MAVWLRGVLAIAAGIVQSRLVFGMLGESDFGLASLIALLAGAAVLLSSPIGNAAERFLAVASGRDEKSGLDETRRVFGGAAALHLSAAVLLSAAALPAGRALLLGHLSVPQGRMDDALLLWNNAVFANFFMMALSPFREMMVARQRIAFLAFAGMALSLANLVLAAILSCAGGDRFLLYGIVLAWLPLLPEIAVMLKARGSFHSCRISLSGLFCRNCLPEMLSYALKRFFAVSAQIAENQGVSVIVNAFFSTTGNAAMTIGRTVSVHSQSLSSALSGAVWPAVAHLYGKGDEDGAKNLSFAGSKTGAALLLLVAVPLMIETGPVLSLWLGSAPAGAAALCRFALAAAILKKLTDGHWMAIYSTGKIAAYNISVGLAGVLLLPAAIFLAKGCMGISGIGLALFLFAAAILAIRLWFGFQAANLSPAAWLRQVFLPVAAIGAVSAIAGILASLAPLQETGGLVLTAFASLSAYLCGGWFLLLSEEDRGFVRRVLLRPVVRFRIKRVLRDVAMRPMPWKALFLVNEEAKWKCESLYNAMKERPEFWRPCIGVTIADGDEYLSGEKGREKYRTAKSFFVWRGYDVVDMWDFAIGKAKAPRDLGADIVFYQQPWGIPPAQSPLYAGKSALTCYVPYYVSNYFVPDFEMLGNFHVWLWRYFTVNESWAERLSGTGRHHCGKVVGLGHPMLDMLQGMPPPKDDGYVIYAPHWSVVHPDNPNEEHYSTFLENGEAILEWAKNHPSVKWAFKPHPTLHKVLVHSGIWSADRVKSYYAQWEKIGRVCYGGEYPDLFAESRAMITDCGSFLVEYASTGRPIIHLVSDSLKAEVPPASKRLFETFYRLYAPYSLEGTASDVILRGIDPNREERMRAYRAFSAGGGSAGRRIEEYLREELLKARAGRRRER